jgi:hypothetical protein
MASMRVTDNRACAPLCVVQSLPSSAPPPYSCRSPLAQLLAKVGPQGRTEAVPVRMQLRRRLGMEEAYHLVNVTPATLDEASRACKLLC